VCRERGWVTVLAPGRPGRQPRGTLLRLELAPIAALVPEPAVRRLRRALGASGRTWLDALKTGVVDNSAAGGELERNGAVTAPISGGNGAVTAPPEVVLPSEEEVAHLPPRHPIQPALAPTLGPPAAFEWRSQECEQCGAPPGHECVTRAGGRAHHPCTVRETPTPAATREQITAALADWHRRRVG
jgi:hypothetical protein